MTVNTEHPEYERMKGEWVLVRACSSGSREVKALKTAVLPAPGSKDGVYDLDRYASYLLRAIYTNITGRTRNGLTGAAFRVPAEVVLPPSIEYLNDNADGAGQSLEQLAKDTFSSLLETGREILLTDYPDVKPGLTAEQEEILKPRATINRYSALSLINWRVEVISGVSVLTLAVLQEDYNDSNEEFGHDNKIQHRVLRLTTEGYSQQLYRDSKPYEPERFPTKGNGERFSEIPIFIVGSQNNDATVDDIPLSDIAHVNVGHFRNSADLEENSYVHGQMTLGVTSDMDDKTFKASNPNGIVVGAQAGHFLGSTGGFHTAQASENQIADKLQERKEGQMLALGAKLVEQRNPNETAAAAKIDATGENSVLGDLVANVEEGIQRSIEWAQMFMNDTGNVTFEMNRKFFDSKLTPEEARVYVELWQGGVISKPVIDSALLRGEIIPNDINLDLMNREIESEPPGLGLDGAANRSTDT